MKTRKLKLLFAVVCLVGSIGIGIAISNTFALHKMSLMFDSNYRALADSIKAQQSQIESLWITLSPVEEMVAYVGPATERIAQTKDRQEAYRLAVIIYETSKYYGIDPYIFEALGTWESRRWNENTNGVDFGYWQVNVGTIDLLKKDPELKRFHVREPEDLFNPIVGAAFGANYLATQYERFGDWSLAIRAYNAGPGAIIRWRKGEHNLNAINIQHHKNVMRIYKEIRPS